MFAKTRAVHQKLAVLAPVIFGVLNTDGCKALANGSSAFVSSENSFARGRDGSGGGTEFCSKLGHDGGERELEFFEFCWLESTEW